MGRSSGNTKDVLLATRVTPRISENVKQMAYREGLNVSEWLRNLIVAELKEHDVLPSRIREPFSDPSKNEKQEFSSSRM
jgi:hypothetical protein